MSNYPQLSKPTVNDQLRNCHSHSPARSNHRSRSPTRITSNTPTASRPTVKELDLELKGLVRWKRFATHLPTIEQSDIEEIQENNRGNIEDQRIAVYGTWLRKHNSASWLDVITALQTIDETVLTEHLKVKHGLVLPHCSISPDVALPQTPLLPNSSPDSYQDIFVPSEVKVVKDLEWLSKCFGDLAADFRKEIERLVGKDETILHDIAIRIEEEDSYTIEGLTAVKTTDELFKLIHPHYNFLDIDLLETIAEYLNCENFTSKIKEHNESVEIFKSTSPVESLRNSIIPYVSMPNSSNPRSIVIIKLQKPWKKRSIKLVERLAESLFPDKSHTFEWFRVMIGSVYVMFLVPEEKTGSLVATSRQKLQFMRLMGVISLQIGSTRVLNEDKNKSFSFDSALLEASQLGNNEAIQFLVDLGAGNNVASNTVVPQATHEEFIQEKLASIFMGAIKQNNLRVVTELMNKVSVIDIQLGVTAACRLGYSTIISLLIKHLQLSPQVFDFFIASLNEDTTSLKQQLAQSGINPNTTLISDITPLMIASSCGHTEVLECLLQAEADVNSKDEDGYTPLAYAITGSKSLTVVQRLLQSGANPNILLGGISIIEKAKEENGTEEIVNLLLEYSALQLYKDYAQLPEKVKKCINDLIEEKKLTILQVAEKIETHFKVTGLTKAQNAHELFNKLQSYYSFLSCDILVDITREFIGGEIENELEGYLVMMRKFQKSVKIKHLKESMSLVPKQDDTSDTCDVNIKLNGEWEEGTLENLQQLLIHMFHNKQHLLNHMTVDERSSLCITFTIPTSQSDDIADEVKRSKEFIECVGVSRVSVGDVDVSIMEDSKFSFRSGLLRAAENGINKAVQFLVEMGVNINDVDSNGRTALMLASKAGHEEIVETLLSAGANGSCQDHVQTAVITDTVLLQHTDIADQGSSILTAAKEDQTAIIETQVTHYRPNKQDNNGLTALMSASHNGHSEVVRILLKGGADPNIQKKDGATAVMLATKNGHSEVVQILLEGGADPNIQKEDGWTALVSACANGHSEVVQILLKGGADPNFQKEDGWTALMHASQNGHSEVVQILLKGGADPNIQKEDGWTALMSASQNGHSEVVQILLKGGADPNIQLKEGQTALVSASYNGHSEVVQILLEGGADPNIQKEDGWTALVSACANGHSEVVQILLKGGADPNFQKEDGWTALMHSSQNGHSEVVQILLKGGADPNIQLKEGQTALGSASHNGHSEVVRILLKGGADPNIQKEDGWTALMHASQNGHSEVVQILLKGGADPNIQKEDGWTALMSASQNGHSEVVQILLKGGADPNIQKEDGWTALVSACANGHSEVVQILLKGGADPNFQKEDGWTALMHASQNGHSEVVQILLKGGADPNIQKEDGWTALMSASQNGHSEVVQILLKGGADPNIQLKEGQTALVSASYNGHSEVVQILLEGGADPNIQKEDGWTALVSACANGHSEVVQILLKGGADPNFQKEDGWTALMHSSQNGHSEVVQILLKGGADPNIQLKEGQTALGSASHNGHSEVVRILLKGGADPNIQKEDGWTALMHASQNGHSEVVQILLKGGADPNIQKEDGWTALMSASQNGHSEVVQILLKGGADPNIQLKEGQTALGSASHNGHSEVVRILLKGGADPNIQKEDGWTALMHASQNGHSEVVQILLKGGADPNIQKEDGWTALMSASQNGHSEVVQILLKGGADPNIQLKEGQTALVSASHNGHSEVVQILLKGGADPNIQLKEGQTALVSASHNGHSEVVQILLKGGADPNIQTEDGLTALMSANQDGHSEVVQILLKGGADPNIHKEDGQTALMFASENGHSEVVEVLLNGGADPNIQQVEGKTALMLASANGHLQVVEILLKGGADPKIKTKRKMKALTFAIMNGHSGVVELLKTHGL